MAYDPIINYYDKPGGPSIPGSDSGSGGGDHGGGGDEATLGSMQNLMLFTTRQPVVGESIDINDYIPSSISDVYVGSQHVIGSIGEGGNAFYNQIGIIASGARVTYVGDFPVAAGATVDSIDVHMYVATTEFEAEGTPDQVEKYVSVVESDVKPSFEIRNLSSSRCEVFVTITQPEIDSGSDKLLVCYVSMSLTQVSS
jgi:hypothetical protein